MKTGKTLAVVVALLVVLSIFPFAMAEENESSQQDNETAEVSQETQHEAEAAATLHGAKIRLLQLEKAIARNIVRGNVVIQYIESQNTSVNTTEMKAIVAEMAALKVQVEAVNPEDNGKEVAKQFVELKADAIDLSKRFRDEAREYLKSKDKDEIKEQMKDEKENPEFADLNAQIKAEARAYNAERLETILKAMGSTDFSLVEKYRSGEISLGEAKKQIRQTFGGFGKERKKDATLKLKEEHSKRFVFGLAVSKEARERNIERKYERIADRLAKISNPKLKAVLEHQLKILKDREARINAHIGVGAEANVSDNDTATGIRSRSKLKVQLGTEAEG